MKQLKIIIEYGLYLFVFFLPIQTRWIIKYGESEYGTISLYGTDILLIILIVLFAVLKFQISNSKYQIPNTITHCHCEEPEKSVANEGRRSNPVNGAVCVGITSPAVRNDSKLLFPIFWFLIIGLELMIFISVFFAADKLIAVYKYAIFLLGIGLFWLIVNANYNKIKLVYCFLAGIFLQSCLGIWQFLAQSGFACKWLGMAEHDASVLGTSVIETISSADGIGERWLRAYGGMDHPNVLGGLLTVGLLITISLIVEFNKCKTEKFVICNLKFGENVKKESDFNNTQFRKKESQITNYQLPITSIFYLLLITCLFFTFSRGAWLGLVIGVLIMLAAMVIKKDLLGQKKLLQIILASSVLIFVLFSQFQDLVLTRLSNDTRLEVKSNSERIELYKDSWELIKDNWLFGVGIGNYTLEIGNRKSEILDDNVFIQPVHNVFLLIWAEIGIFGLLFFILIPLCIMYNLLFKNNLRSKNLILSVSLLAAISTMFMIDHWWWSLHFGVLLFWLVMGLLIIFEKSEELA